MIYSTIRFWTNVSEQVQTQIRFTHKLLNPSELVFLRIYLFFSLFSTCRLPYYTQGNEMKWNGQETWWLQITALHFAYVDEHALLCMEECGPVGRALDSRTKDLGFDSHCWSCVKMLGKLLIPYHLRQPSSDGYLVEREKYTVMIGHSCNRICNCWILPRGDETRRVCSNTRGVNYTVRRTHGDIRTIVLFKIFSRWFLAIVNHQIQSENDCELTWMLQ